MNEYISRRQDSAFGTLKTDTEERFELENKTNDNNNVIIHNTGIQPVTERKMIKVTTTAVRFLFTGNHLQYNCSERLEFPRNCNENEKDQRDRKIKRQKEVFNRNKNSMQRQSSVQTGENTPHVCLLPSITRTLQHFLGLDPHMLTLNKQNDTIFMCVFFKMISRSVFMPSLNCLAMCKGSLTGMPFPLTRSSLRVTLVKIPPYLK